MDDVTPREQLVCIMMKRKYGKQGITLPNKFWNLPKYKKEFITQSVHANKLIKAYSKEAIFNVINRETWCWSLGMKKLHDLIAIEQARLDTEQKIRELKEEQKQPEVDMNLPLFRKKENG